MSRMLSSKQKLMNLPLLIQRDGGFVCFYCKKQLQIGKFVFDHLNCIRPDNRIDNLVLSCQSCNIKKANDFDLAFKAKEKLLENESRIFVVEKISTEDKGQHHVSTEIDINVTNFDITKQYISEIIASDNYILLKDALDSSSYLCKERTDHGSQQSVRNYIDMLTSAAGPFMITRNENNKKIIVRRTGK